jgi:uncharacterized protein involved in response to NO
LLFLVRRKWLEGIVTSLFLSFLGSMISLRLSKGRREFCWNDVTRDVVVGLLGSSGALLVYDGVLKSPDFETNPMVAALELLVAFLVLNLGIIREVAYKLGFG